MYVIESGPLRQGGSEAISTQQANAAGKLLRVRGLQITPADKPARKRSQACSGTHDLQGGATIFHEAAQMLLLG